MANEGEQTRARLLAEARDLYLEVGIERLSLREVARRSGVSAPAVYRHFDSKEALLGEVCAEGFRIFSSYLLRALSAAGAHARMVASAEQYLRFALEHPSDYRAIFMAGAGEAPRVIPQPKNSARYEGTFQFLVDRVRECMQEKVLRKADPEETAAIIWAHVHGLVSLRLSGHLGRAGNDAQFKRFYLHASELLLAGLAE
jgi:AcrR family transcriptional regulator